MSLTTLRKLFRFECQPFATYVRDEDSVTLAVEAQMFLNPLDSHKG